MVPDSTDSICRYFYYSTTKSADMEGQRGYCLYSTQTATGKQWRFAEILVVVDIPRHAAP